MIIRAFVLVVLLFGALVSTFVPAGAQGPMTPQQILDTFLTKGGTEVSRGIVQWGADIVRGKCEIKIRFKTPLTSYGTDMVADMLGMKEGQLIQYLATNADKLYLDTRYSDPYLFVSLYLHPSFCGPPGGQSPAQNPLSPSPATNPISNNMMVVFGGLAALLGGMWIFPRLVGGLARI